MKHEKNEASIVALGTAFFAAVIATFPSLFFINPFWLAPYNALTVAQIIFLFAWPIQLAVWPATYFLMKPGFVRTRTLQVVSLIWPATIVIVQFAVLATFGRTGLTYLLDKPVFVITDLIIPFIYWKIAHESRQD